MHQMLCPSWNPQRDHQNRVKSRIQKQGFFSSQARSSAITYDAVQYRELLFLILGMTYIGRNCKQGLFWVKRVGLAKGRMRTTSTYPLHPLSSTTSSVYVPAPPPPRPWAITSASFWNTNLGFDRWLGARNILGHLLVFIQTQRLNQLSILLKIFHVLTRDWLVSCQKQRWLWFQVETVLFLLWFVFRF